MALLLFHSSYIRTCSICGDRWVVSRRQAKGSPGKAPRPRRVGGRNSVAMYDVGRSSNTFNEAVELWQAWRRCPHCGIDAFTQRPAGRPSGP